MKPNHLNKSLDELEGVQIIATQEESTYLVNKVAELRKKRLKYLSIEDLRLLIGQSISLCYVIPLAIEKLTENIMAEGDYYEGDLLQNVLSADKDFWLKNQILKGNLKQLLLTNTKYINSFITSKKFKDDLNIFLES